MAENNKTPLLFDSHAHYVDGRYGEEYEGGADALLCHLFSDGGVGYVMNVATNPRNAADVVAMTAKYENMFCAVGIHPSDIHEVDATVEEQIGMLRALLIKKEEYKIKAIGEIGLDYYWEPVLKDEQMAFLKAQIDLALEYDMPIIIHDREAHGDIFDTVVGYKGLRGVFHCYSGSAEMAKEIVKKGFYIAFGGTVTFKNARKVVEAAREVPLDRLLIETDCPYLAPVPHRGKLNHSGLAIETAKVLADIKDVSVDELVRITTENARRLFEI